MWTKLIKYIQLSCFMEEDSEEYYYYKHTMRQGMRYRSRRVSLKMKVLVEKEYNYHQNNEFGYDDEGKLSRIGEATKFKAQTCVTIYFPKV